MANTFIPTTFGALALLLTLAATPAHAQGGVGAISGTVRDESGSVLPGATVMLSNPGVIGGSQQTVTDERGTYQFPRLIPGTYSVRGELAGFRAGVRENIVINADFTGRADLTLSIGELAETVTVAGDSPLIDTASTLNQTVLQREVLDTLPQGRDLWSIARLVPGVLTQRYDVGGSNALLLSSASVHGSLTAESSYLIDNVDVSWSGGDGGSQANGWDSNMFQEINYQLGNASAEYQKGGVVYNMVTRTGTNTFHGSAGFTGTRGGLSSDNVTPSLLSDLRAGVPALALQANPDLNPAARVLSFFDSSESLSGPIVKDRLWFAATGQLMRLNRYAIGSYNLDGSQFVEDFATWNISAKASWQVSRNSQLHYTHLYNFLGRYHLTYAREFYEPNSTYLYKSPSHINQVRWTNTLSSRLLLDVGGAIMTNMWPEGVQPGITAGTVPRLDAVTRQHIDGVGTYDNNPNYTDSLTASLTYARSGHNLKAGYQFSRRMDRKEAWSMSHYPAGLLAIYRDGVPNSVNTYNTPTDISAYLQDHGLFVQDSWQATSRMTLNVGLRIQKTNGWIPAGCQTQTVFIAAQCFDAIEDTPDWLDAAPRFGLIYDLFGDGRTALKVSANRYNLGIGSAFVNRVNPLRVTSDTRPWTDTNGNGLPELDELGPSTGYNLGTTNRYNPDVRRPRVNEYSVEFQRQLPGNLVAAAGYFRRETRGNIGSRNLAVPASGYTPLQVTERSSGQQVTVFNQDPATRGMFDVLWDNYSELDGTFNGVDLTVNKRMSRHWMLMGGLSLGKNITDNYSAGTDLNNPNNTFRKGRDPRDVPVSFKLSGAYELPWRLSVAGTIQHFTGLPESTTVLVASDTVALTQVSQSVRIVPNATTRLPDNDLIDLSLRRKFAGWRGASLEPVLEVFNLTNANTIQGWLTQLGPTYHRSTSIQFPRMLRLGVNVKF